MTTAQQIQFERIAAAIEFLYDHHREQPDLAAVAAHVHLSPQHLQRQFQQWAGISPKKMLPHISIENAKRLLNWEPTVEMSETIGNTLDFFLREAMLEIADKK